MIMKRQTGCLYHSVSGLRGRSRLTAKAIAMAFPMPEDAPVTRAVRPCRSFCPFPTMLFKQPAAPTGFGPWLRAVCYFKTQ